jgi:hypothetical protein
VSRGQRLSEEISRCEARIAKHQEVLHEGRQELAAVRAEHERLADQLDEIGAGYTLRLAPLVWSLIGALAALTAMMLSYILALVSAKELTSMPFLPAWIVAIVLAGLTIKPSRRPGAGGSARALLRRVTWGGSGLSILASLILFAWWALL